MKSTHQSNSFTSGEWSPRGKGRFDLAKYASGASRLENFIINQLGGVSYRPGTRFIAETKDSSLASRLIPFQYSADSDYVIEMGNQYFKLYENDTDAVVDTAADTYTKLLIHANGVDAYGILGGSVIDSSTSPRAISKVATVEISPTQFKFGNASIYFDGDSDYLTALDHADWNFAAGDFTLDFRVYFNGITTEQPFFFQYEDGNNHWSFRKLNSGSDHKLYFYAIGGGTERASYIMTNAWSPSIGNWYHIAFVRDGAGAHLFIDGTEQTLTETIAFGTLIDLAADLVIGARAGVNFVNGYMDEIRISKGLARWTTDFAVPTAEYTADANTQLLLHGNTLDFSSTTSPKITTFVGTAQLDTAQYKDLTGYTTTRASLLLDGNSDYLTFPNSADFDFGTEDWTIETFVRFAGIAAQQTICGQYEDANNYWFIQITAANKIQVKFVNGGVTKADYISDAIAGIAINTWYHVMVVRYANATGVAADEYIKIFVDGTEQVLTETTAVTTNDLEDTVSVLSIGQQNAGTWFNGHIDEFRITKGLARQTVDFTPTTAEYALTPIVTTELTTPYLTAELFDVQYAQNNDVLYLVHPNWQPRKLTRTSATAFSIALVALVRPPFMDTNIVAATQITPTSDTGATTLNVTAATDIFHFVSGVAAGSQKLVGSYFRVKSGVVKIATVVSAIQATGTVQAEPSGAAGTLATGPGATSDWAEGAWSDYRGWPSSVAFHEQRLYYAKDQKFWGSYIGAYDSFDQTAVTDNYAIGFEVSTEQRNNIKWLSSGNKALNIGSQGGTFSATSGETTATIAPDNIVVSRETNYGVAGLLPKRISSFLYYLQRDFVRLREVAYSLEADAQVSNDMNLLAEHILKDGDGAVDLDHQQAPNDRIYCVRDDGQMAVLTRNPEQEVMGWCRFIAGEDAKGNGEFESVCVIPKASSDDQVWVIVKRNINGSVKRYIEFFQPEDFDEDWDAIRCDSSLTLDAPSTITGVTIATDLILYTAGTVALADGDQIKINGVVGTTDINGIFLVDTLTLGVSFKIKTLAGVAIDFATYDAWISGGEIRKMVTNISGLDHLVGETVVAQIDGYIPATETYVVGAGGTITLSEKAAVVHAGLPYTGTIQLLKLSDGSQTGTGQTKERRIYLGTLRLHRSQGLSIGRTNSTLDDLNYNEEVSPTALYTGDMKKVFQTTWFDADEIQIVQTKPLPAEILALIFRSEVEEG